MNINTITHVNNVWTIEGGKHGDYLVDQFVNYFLNNFKISKNSKHGKDSEELLKHLRKNQNTYIATGHIYVFINCLIETPMFDAQTKTKLTRKSENFGIK